MWTERYKGAVKKSGYVGSINEFTRTFGPMPNAYARLERIDCSKPISKGNYRWALRSEDKEYNYGRAVAEAEIAEPGERCPYDELNDIGMRTAWLAAHYDKYGFDAWAQARGSNDIQE